MVAPSLDSVEFGEYFCRWRWILFPLLPKFLNSLAERPRRLRTKVGALRARKGYVAPKDIFGRLRRSISEVKESSIALYSAQPDWSFCDFRVTSLAEAVKVVAEFLSLVESATLEFCWPLAWPLHQPTELVDWKRHSWKHVFFGSIREFLVDASAGQELPPQVRLELIGTFEDAQELFRKAARREPEAVARIESLFPTREDRRCAAEHLFEQVEPPQELPRIPSVADLAAEFATHAVHDPDSEEADKFRKRLRVLMSKRAAKGSAAHGRPRIPHHDVTVVTAYMMSYGLAKQLKEVCRFLEQFQRRDEEWLCLIDQLYPWVSGTLHLSVENVLTLETSKSACQIAGKALGLSPSKVEKTVYR